MSKQERLAWTIAAVLGIVIVVLGYLRFVKGFVPAVPGVNE